MFEIAPLYILVVNKRNIQSRRNRYFALANDEHETNVCTHSIKRQHIISNQETNTNIFLDNNAYRVRSPGKV